MKTLIFSAFLCLPTTFVLANTDTALLYRHLVPITGETKDGLYERAKSWFDGKFMSSKLVLENENKETGELKGKGIMQFKSTVAGKPLDSKVTYDVVIKVANTGYLFSVSNFIHQFPNKEFTGFGLLTSSNTSPVTIPTYNEAGVNSLWLELKQEVGLRIEPLMDKLKATMKAKPRVSNSK